MSSTKLLLPFLPTSVNGNQWSCSLDPKTENHPWCPLVWPIYPKILLAHSSKYTQDPTISYYLCDHHIGHHLSHGLLNSFCFFPFHHPSTYSQHRGQSKPNFKSDHVTPLLKTFLNLPILFRVKKQNKTPTITKNSGWHYISRPFITIPFNHLAPAIMASLLFFKHVRKTPNFETWHLLLLLCLPADMYMVYLLTSLKSTLSVILS